MDATLAAKDTPKGAPSVQGVDWIVRPVRRADLALVLRGFRQLGPDSRYQRFFTPKARLTREELRALSDGDGEHAFALGLVRRDAQGREHPAGLARYVRLAAPDNRAEAAVTIVDAMQGRGLGKLLFRMLSDAARRHGITHFRAQVLSENVAIHKLLRSIDPHARVVSSDPGSEEYELVLPEPDGTMPAYGRAFRLTELQ